MKTTSNLTTLKDIIADILKDMPEKDKVTLASTPEEDLIAYHHSWGRNIRNRYNLWQNPEALEDIGEAHPDDASSVIIQAVWQRLQGGES